MRPTLRGLDGRGSISEKHTVESATKSEVLCSWCKCNFFGTPSLHCITIAPCVDAVMRAWYDCVLHRNIDSSNGNDSGGSDNGALPGRPRGISSGSSGDCSESVWSSHSGDKVLYEHTGAQRDVRAAGERRNTGRSHRGRNRHKNCCALVMVDVTE